MKLFHISDLHIGKRVNGFSMLEDQKYILNQIVDLAAEQRPDGILIAGDLYDRSMPSAEAVEVADDFLYQFARLQIPVFLISGNHDCAERIAYGGRMMEQAGIYVSRVFDGELQKYTMQQVRKNAGDPVNSDSADERKYTVCKEAEEYSENDSKRDMKKEPRKISERKCMQNNTEPEQVDIWLLPYIRPAQVRRFFPEEEIETTQQAIEVILKNTELNKDRVNILVMHQFLAGASVCESEEISVGGSDQVEVSVVDAFDYVALGHLHGPQKVGRDTVRYCGSPLKYSFSEARHQKSVTVVEFSDQICISQLPLISRLDLREISGPIDELLRPEVYESANPLDYLHVTLTDKNEVLDAIGRLRDVYPNVMRLDFETAEGSRNREQQEPALEEKTPMELFAEFFALQNGYEMNDEQRRLICEIWGEAEENKDETAAKGGDGV